MASPAKAPTVFIRKGGFQRCYNNVRLIDGAGPCLSNIERLDAGAAPMIARMQRTGMRVDLDHFARMEKTLVEDMDRITEDVRSITGYYCNLNSGDQIADLLFNKLGLKQARVKLTNSGDRESVEDAVLIAIQHDHPVIPKMLEFKEYSKLLGTYVRPMPKLATHIGPDEWLMFPKLGQSRVPAGRLNCKSPNLLAMPTRTERGREIRKGFIARKGRKVLSVDLCLHPDTEVWTFTGPTRIKDIKEGDFVLSYKDGRIDYGKVTASGPRLAKSAYRLTFDNDTQVIASFDHRWPVRSKRKKYGRATESIKKTHELDIGERMIPCKEGWTGMGRTWYSKSAFEYTVQHHLVAKALLGPRPDGYHVHHKDGDHDNNHPSNLEYKEAKQHWSDHWPDSYKKVDQNKRLAMLREGIKYRRRRYYGENNPNSRLSDVDRDAIKVLFTVDGWTTRQVSEYFKISQAYAAELAKRFRDENHKLTAKEHIGIQPMWYITVEPHHNYVLACGVVTMNSNIEPRVATHRSKDPELMRVYHNEEDTYSDFAIGAFKIPDKRYRATGAEEAALRAKGKSPWVYPGVDSMEHRRPCKICVLAALYEVTNVGLLEQMPVICKHCNKDATKHTCGRFESLWNEDNCQDILNAFFMRYGQLLVMRKRDHATTMKHAMMWCMWGRLLHVAAVRSVLNWVVSQALREASNFPMSSSSQGVLKLAMAQLEDEFVDMGLYGDVADILLQVHDELLYDVHEDMVEEIKAHVVHRFKNVVRLDVPLEASGSSADDWGSIDK